MKEVYHLIKDSYRKKCEKCRSHMKKIPTQTSPPQFNGSGFYETDYKRKVKVDNE
jgi:predicted nucleic acid-binding Zn ribbon protein